MDQSSLPNLPRHVLERVERRWAAVLSYQSSLRSEKKFPGMEKPSPDRQAPEREPAQPLSKSKRPDWNALF